MRSLRYTLLVTLVGIILGSTGAVFAQTVQQQTHNSQITSCVDGTFTMVYYRGEDGNQPTEDFISASSNVHWKFNVNSSQNPSYVSLYNPFTLITLPSFSWVSNGRPKNVADNILAWSADAPLTVGTNLNGYNNRNNIAAQLVFWLHRNSWNDGFIPRTINYTPIGGGPQSQAIQHATTANSDGGGYECLNIHVAFCGDGIVDDTNTPYSNVIGTKLAGGEICDDGNTNNTDACKNDCTRNTPVCGGVNGQTYYDDVEPPLGDEINVNTPNLCPAGQTVVNFAYNATLDQWTWNCWYNVPGAPQSSQCIAYEDHCGDGTVQTGNNEACDDGNTNNNDACNNACQYNPGVCGGANGQTYYDDMEPPLGDEINASSPNLCPAGQTVINFTYANGQRTWNCERPGGPDSPLCTANEDYCGDGTVQTGNNEACDDGNTNNNDACNNACQYNPGVCGGVNGQTYYDDMEPPLGDELSASSPNLCPAGQTVINFTYANGQRTWNCERPGGPDSPLCMANEDYCGDNEVQIGQGEVCDGTGQPQCPSGQSCNASCGCTSDPIPGVCGGANGQTYYDDMEPPLGDEINQGTPGLCTAGLVVNFVYSGGLNGWTWACQGQFGGPNSPVCIALEDYCGDGIPQNNRGEVCDDGNNIDTDACDNSCQPTLPGVCGSADGATYYAFTNSGTALNQNSLGLCPVGQTVINRNWDPYVFSRECVGPGGPSPVCEAEESYCGDGTVGVGINYTNQEQCDDGNTDPFDACVTYSAGVPVCENAYCGDGYVQLNGADGILNTSDDEDCDDGNQINGDGCDNDCTLTPNPGICASAFDGTEIYDSNNSGDYLTINTPGLCANGTVANFEYDPVEHEWTRDCLSPNGGTGDACQAIEKRCGDGGTPDYQNGEMCDGVGQAQCDVGQTCSGCTCISNPSDGVCSSTYDLAEIYDFNNSGDYLTINTPGLCANGVVTNFLYNTGTHTWTWTCSGVNGGVNDSCSAEEFWCGNGYIDNLQGSNETCETNADCSSGESCDGCQCITNPIDGICGTVDGTDIYDVNNNGDSLTGGSVGLCASGYVAMFTFNNSNPYAHFWTWQCIGISGGSTDFCQAQELWCGDHEVQFGFQGAQEICDGVGQAQCGDGYVCNACNCAYEADCGNGIVDPGEVCDDGNGNNTDECTNACTLTICGDGIVQNPNGEGINEWCDDGNTSNTDGCTNTCMETYCGDGTVQTPNAQGQNELCDDGNQNNNDGCNNSCQPNPLCGNGIVDPGEICDDGNNIAGDGCGPSCQDEFCGDLYRDPNGGDNVSGTSDDEACEQDVHCPIPGSRCVSGCDCVVPVPAICGDGIVQAPNSSGFNEQCDDGNQIDTDGCKNNCTLPIPSVCESLSVTTTTQNAPMNIAYNCIGTGSDVEVQLFNSAGSLLSGSSTPVGNFLVTLPDTYTVICSYDGVTSPACQRTVDVGGYCEDLTAIATTGQTYDFTCTGVGSNYLLVISNDQQQVVTTATATGDFTYTYTFMQTGTYTAICFVDGISNSTCGSAPASGFTTQSFGKTPGQQFASSTDTVVTVKSSPTTHLTSVSQVDYAMNGFTPVKSLVPLLQTHAIDKHIHTVLTNLDANTIAPVTTKPPVVLLSPFDQQVAQTTTTIANQLTTFCYNTCLETITIGSPEVPVCTLTTLPTTTIVQAGALTVTGSCAFGNVQGTGTLDCGNGTILSGSSGACYYTGNGSRTMSCLLDGQTFSGCSQPVKLSSGGGGNNYCGDGEIGPGEMCDDGNTVSGDGCSSTCKKEGGGSSGGGNPSSIKCGNGKLDPGEVCDDGIKNGKQSVCTTSCTLKGITPVVDGDTVPKCAFVDPPSIQLGELLPFWRAVEDDKDIGYDESCDALDEGKIPGSSLRCHFTVEAPDGTTYKIDESCTSEKLKSVKWYNDLQKDLGFTLSSTRGQSYIDTAKRTANVYGEYTITLDKITYAICTETAAASGATKASYAMAYNQSYAGRVCQFNFAVTTPYLIQKGTALSSFPDDREKLKKFRRIDGRTVLDMSDIILLEQTSSSDAFAAMKKTVYAAADKAVQAIDVAHPLGGLDSGFRKVPNQELYVIDNGFTLRHASKSRQFNNGKPTTIIVRGAVGVKVSGSLPGNLLLVAPEGTVTFINEDCDVTDTIEATIVAAKVTSTLAVANANRSLTSNEWCTDGKLIIKGVLVSESRGGIEDIRSERRSTLHDWFNGESSKSEHIYAGASLRIESRPSVWASQPPLATNNSLFFKTQGHGSADELTIPLPAELLEVLLPLLLHHTLTE